jgi:PAS domain S-box-containing protein
MYPNNLRVLVGWKEIAAYLNCSRSTAVRRVKDGLPVFRVGGNVRAFSADIDRWLAGERLAELGKRAEDEPEAPGVVVKGENLLEALSALTLERGELRYAVVPLGIDTSEYRQIERRLRTAEEKYRWLLETVPVWIWETNAEDEYTYSNVASLDILGYRPEELGGFKPEDFLISDEDVPKFGAEMRKLRSTKRVIRNQQCRFVHRDASEIWLETDAEPVFDARGDFTGIRGVSRDITERKVAEARISEQREFLLTVLESLTHPFYVIDVRDYRVTLANSATAAFGFRDGITCYQLTHNRQTPCEAERHTCPLRELVATGSPTSAQHVHYDTEGRERFVEVRAYPIFDARGDVAQVIEYCLDVTDRARAEERLRENEALLRNVVSNAPVAIYAYDRNGVITLSDGKGCYATGYEPGELVGVNVFERYGEKSALARPVRRALAGEEVEAVVTVGNDRCFDARYTPLRDGEGRVVGAVAVGTDITERERAEEALRRSEEKSRSIVEHSRDGIILVDEAGYVVEYNRGLEQISGVPRAEAVGRPAWEILYEALPTESKNPAARERLKKLVVGILSTGQVPEEGALSDREVQRPDGTRRTVQQSVFPIKTDAGYMAGAILRDVTEHKAADQKVLATEAQLREVLNTVNDEISFVDAEETIVFASREFAELLGAEPAELKGKALREIAPEEEFAKYVRETGKRRRGESSEYDTALRHQKGSLRRFRISCRPLFNDEGEFLGTLGKIVGRVAT